MWGRAKEGKSRVSLIPVLLRPRDCLRVNKVNPQPQPALWEPRQALALTHLLLLLHLDPRALTFFLFSKEAVQRGKVGLLLRASGDSWAGGGSEAPGAVAAAEGSSDPVTEKPLLLAGRTGQRASQTSPDRALGGEAAAVDTPRPGMQNQLQGGLGEPCLSLPSPVWLD